MTVSWTPQLSVAIDRIARQLARDFEGTFSKETIARYTEEAAEALSSEARIPDYIPVFVESLARGRLRALAKSRTPRLPEPG